MKKVSVRGVIVSNDEKFVYDWFGMDATSPGDVSAVLDEANGEGVEVEINSGGGSVFAGSEIYTALKDYSGDVTVKILGIAASAASVIAMAGDRVLMSPTAQMMVHNVRAAGEGDYRDHSHTAEILKNANKTIANAYRMKTGMDEGTLLDMMNEETWLTPQKALEKGFVDEIMFESETKLAGRITAQMLPRQVIDKIRNELNPVKPKREKPDILMAKFKLLKLKGSDEE